MGPVARQLLPCGRTPGLLSLCKYLDRADPRGASSEQCTGWVQALAPRIMETHRVDSSSSSSLRCVTQALTFRALLVKWQ